MEPDHDDRSRYMQTMSEIRHRLHYAYESVASKDRLSRRDLETAALQLRTAIELLVMASLVSNRQAVAEIAPAFHKKGMNDALKLVRRVNPKFWPQPIKIDKRDGTLLTASTVKQLHLTEDEFQPEWGYLSEELLHAANPYAPSAEDPEEELRAHREHILTLWFKLDTLMKMFFVRLPNTSTWMLYESDHVEGSVGGNLSFLVVDEPD